MIIQGNKETAVLCKDLDSKNIKRLVELGQVRLGQIVSRLISRHQVTQVDSCKDRTTRIPKWRHTYTARKTHKYQEFLIIELVIQLFSIFLNSVLGKK